MVAIRWDVLTLGHLSRNKFWGEPDTEPRRAPRCTATLIRTPDQIIVADPGHPPAEMARILDERAGLTPEAVDIVFLTHFHGDHRVGVTAFPRAVVYMGRDEIADWQTRVAPESTEGELLARLVPAPETIVPGVARLDTPGHTPGHCSLVFTSDGRRVVVSGDAVMTRDFFAARDYYFNTVDPEAATRSLDAIRALADIVVPGHDNFFLVPPADRPAGG
ncbi:MAG: MBL fold metallo-hydrolase [Chloroflexota bacterium]|nr:MBL fold metallo-hydrolase [Chloroflexota bacterium]